MFMTKKKEAEKRNNPLDAKDIRRVLTLFLIHEYPYFPDMWTEENLQILIEYLNSKEIHSIRELRDYMNTSDAWKRVKKKASKEARMYGIKPRSKYW